MRRWGVLALIVLLAAPLFAPFDPMRTGVGGAYEAPSTMHLFGTDGFGRDVLSRFLVGGQRTLLLAMGATALAGLVGGGTGLLLPLLRRSPWRAGRFGAALLDGLLGGLLALPGLVVALSVSVVLGNVPAALVIGAGISQIAPLARLTSAAVERVLRQPHIEGATALGAGSGWVWRWHVLPLIGADFGAALLIAFNYALLTSAALAFLGIGTAPGTPDWGAMLYEGRQAFRAAPWVAAAPGVGITLLVWLAAQAAVKD